MESRRFILALSLSMLVFLVYVRFFAPAPPMTPVAPETEKTEAAQEKPAQTKQLPFTPGTAARSITPAAAGREILVETDLVKASVNTAGGVITGWELKKYREADKSDVGLGILWKKINGQAPKEEKSKKELGNVQLLPVYDGVDRSTTVSPLTIAPLDASLSGLAQVEYQTNRNALRLGADKESETLILTYKGPSGIVIEKRLTFYNDDYKVDVSIETRGLEGYTLSLGTDFGIADKVSKDASGRVGMVALADGKSIFDKISGIKDEVQYSGLVEWFGQADKYFTATLVSGNTGLITCNKTTAPPDIGDLLTTNLTVREKPEERTFTLYAGPKSFTLLKAHGHGLEQMVDYGWFGVLAKPMFWLMKKFHSLTGNYGIAIILLTIVVRALLFYPSLKSATAMEGMKKIQPELTAVREKYKKDPAKMNQEMMKLYKEHKVNPVGGCLPMVLQFPFFIALYNVLSVSIELRQAPFISFWIKDLSVYDPFYILPVVMGLSMILTMKITAATPDPKQAKIMMVMNIAFIFMFAWLPAGLLLYITLSNVLSIAQQLYVRKLIGATSAPSPAR